MHQIRAPPRPTSRILGVPTSKGEEGKREGQRKEGRNKRTREKEERDELGKGRRGEERRNPQLKFLATPLIAINYIELELDIYKFHQSPSHGMGSTITYCGWLSVR